MGGGGTASGFLMRMARREMRRAASFGLAMGVIGLPLLLMLPVSTKQGINYEVRVHRIPLWVKLVEFLDRDYHFRAIVRDVAPAGRSAEERALALFQWTRTQVRAGIPEGLPVIDDHLYYVIVRGYGTHDQLTLVFVTLCAYAGIPAAGYRLTGPDGQSAFTIAIAQIAGRWVLFDTWEGVVARNHRGELASLDDLIREPALLDEAAAGRLINGQPYRAYFRVLPKPDTLDLERSYRQMPFGRVRCQWQQWWVSTVDPQEIAR